MSKDENNLLMIKYQSKPLGTLSDVELLKAATILLLKIHAITGWTIPEKEMKNILVDQFIKKIKESYPNVNENEVEYAFRQNFVKDWGKSMNLALIDEVLSDYLEKRSDVSRTEERYKLAVPVKEFHSLSDDEFIESNRKKYTESKNYLLITVLCYEMLVRSGKINLTNEEKIEIKKKVTANYFSLENKAEIQNKSQGEKEREIKQNCMKWATANYFNSL